MSTRIIYGDCRTVLPNLETHSFDLCLTDPPYRVSNWDSGFGVNELTYADVNGNIPKPPEYREWLWEVKRVLKDNGQLVVFEHPRNAPELMEALKSFGFIYKTIGMWHVTNRMGFYKGPFYRNHADIWIWCVKSSPYTFNYLMKNEMSEVITEPAVTRTDKRVPGAKPLSMIERFVKVHTDPGDWVIDPFLGSGTTLKACVRTGRNGVGIEIREELRELHEKETLSKVRPMEAFA